MIMPHLIWLPIASAVLVALAVLFWYIYIKSRDSWSSWDIGAIGFSIGGGILVLITISAYIPFDSKYQVFTEHAGTVASVNSALQYDSDYVVTGVVVQFVGDDNLYTSEDVRVANLKPGDEASLVCSLEWKYAGADKYNCNLN